MGGLRIVFFSKQVGSGGARSGISLSVVSSLLSLHFFEFHRNNCAAQFLKIRRIFALAAHSDVAVPSGLIATLCGSAIVVASSF
ncbi:hypothetical protein BOX37_07720 [Nocardia mangyaensis]|uniref:Uncharacterized protein n=1 Tax=Nocardia mangyaensis TaxID=2213200 RepID=A0A1J0VPB2_9NOCA|nr:hypothetical protein BOX37_07720 [Nocardia mangyaensis]